MSVMRDGYGSEWHMRTLLANCAADLDPAIRRSLGQINVPNVSEIEWHQNYRAPGLPEICGLDFLGEQTPARTEWQSWWPQTGSVHNWDGIGTIRYSDGRQEWLLLEAKANIEELRSSTRAKKHGGLDQIVTRLRETQQACGVTDERDWTLGFYQYANRLAVLHFLLSRGITARLFFIYFAGDRGDARRTCPTCADEWERPLAEMKASLGLVGTSELEKHVHHLFIQVGTANEPRG